MNNDWKPTEINEGQPTNWEPRKQHPEEVANGLRNAFRQAIKDGVMDATPYLKQMTSNKEIELLKQEIKMLKSKLAFLEELEKTKSPVEEAYKDWWGQYPELETDSEYDDMRWQGFRAGFQAAYEEKVREDDYYDKVELGRKDNPKPMDEVVDKMLKEWEENPPEFLKFELGKTLEALITRWWCDVFTTHEDWDMETAIDDLVDRIELFLPKEQSAAGSQNAYVESAVEGFNDCLNTIKRKLR
jgi:hypothetical protein